MKKILVFLFLMTLIISANAQNQRITFTNNTTTIQVNYSGTEIVTIFKPSLTISIASGYVYLNVQGSQTAIPILYSDVVSPTVVSSKALYDTLTSWINKYNWSLSVWSLMGNSGVTTSNFIGTTNGEPLIFKTNSVEDMRILSNGRIGIGISSPSQKFQVIGSGSFSDTLYSNGKFYGTGITDTGGVAVNSYFLVESGTKKEVKRVPKGATGMSSSSIIYNIRLDTNNFLAKTLTENITTTPLFIGYTETGFTMDSVFIGNVRTGASLPDYYLTIKYGTDISTAGTEVMATTELTSYSTITRIYSFTAAMIPKHSMIWLRFPTIKTAPNNALIRIYGH